MQESGPSRHAVLEVRQEQMAQPGNSFLASTLCGFSSILEGGDVRGAQRAVGNQVVPAAAKIPDIRWALTWIEKN